MSLKYSGDWDASHMLKAEHIPVLSLVLLASTCALCVFLVQSACNTMVSSTRRALLDVVAPETLRAPVPEEFVHLEDYAKASKQFQLTGDWATEAE